MEQLNLQERTGCVTSVGELIGTRLPSIREALSGGTHNQPSPLPTQDYSSPKLGEVPQSGGGVCNKDLGNQSSDSNLNDLAKALKRGAYKTVQGEVSATKLYDTASERIDCLVEPLLPRVGIVALVGSSDSGKSSLLRGLALAVSSGADQWLGLPLRTEHQRALYISTEDDEHSIGALLRKQNQELGLGRGDMAGLDFVFEADNPLLRTELTLNEKAVDLVVVDAFSDVYRGALNENNKVRAYLQEWSELAQKYQCLVIFLHHTGKRTEALLPSKHNSIGSQGFEAKMRLMMELRTDKVDSSLRHLCVVKGNYLGPEWKGKSFVLRFSPSLNYTNTGDRVDFDELCHLDQSGEVSVVNDSRKVDEQARYEAVMDMLAEGMTYQQIADSLGLRSRSSVHRIIHR